MTRKGMNLALGLMILGMAILIGGPARASEVVKMLGETARGDRNMVRLSDYKGGGNPSDGGLDDGGNWLRKDGVMTFVVDDAGKAKGEGTIRTYHFVMPPKDSEFFGLQGFRRSGGGISFNPVPESGTILPLVALVGLCAVWLWRRVARGGIRFQG